MKPDIGELQQIAYKIREDIITTGRDCDVGVHIGGNLTLTEIMAVLFFYKANLDPENLDWEDRDRIILSKGHGNVALSSAMARIGFFDLDELKKFDTFNSMLSMHIDKHRMPGVEISSGSLGHGLSVAVGAAIGAKMNKADWQTYCIVSDGELMEGSVWEAIMSAGHFRLDNLTMLVDRNGFTIEGDTEDHMSLEPLDKKLEAFNWDVRTIDGHGVKALVEAFDAPTQDRKPKAIIAKTIKGRGVPALEGKASSHFLKIKPEDAEEALALLQSLEI
ncbi:MAG: transketolase [Brevefilum sp.]|jgi:transketolase